MIAEPLVVPVPVTGESRGVGSLLADYFSLTKPRIMLLLLITEFGAMIAAARGWPGTSLTLAALAGGALSAGGAAAVNCWFACHIDAGTGRTRAPPLPAGPVSAAPSLSSCGGLSRRGL